MPPKKIENLPEKKPEARKLRIFDLSRKVLLAAVGAVALAQDEIEEYVQRLVERGEIAEKDGKSLMKEVLARRKKVREKIKQETSQRLSEAFSKMNMPTKQDFAQLKQEIAELSKKVEELKKS
jgi:poly(hydroxyalkanoate) granule-associated protein